MNDASKSSFSLKPSVNSYSVKKQLLFILFGFLGFQLIGVVVSVLFQVFFMVNNPEATAEQILAYLNQPSTSFYCNIICYVALFGILLLVLGKTIPDLAKSFLNVKAYLWAIFAFVAVYVFEAAYGTLIDWIYALSGAVRPGVNANESGLREMFGVNPAIWLLVFGLIGPFCEEITYRVGLFGLTSRLGKVVGIILSGLVFGLIHFGWTELGTTEGLVTELINLPSYVVSGIIYAYVYYKGGFASSYVAHAANNLLAGILLMLS